MRKSVTVAVAAMFGSSVMAFAPSTLLRPTVSPSTTAVGLKMAYIPDGLSPKEWKKIQAEEKKKKQDLGRMGPSRFKSRSFQAWQDAGAGHLFPVDPKKVKSGEIPIDKVPYMQRGGAWDDSDLLKNKKDTQVVKRTKVVTNDVFSKKIEKKKWSNLDKEYASGGYVKEQSVSIFGGAPLPWATNSKKSPGVETDNKRRLTEQKKVNRPSSKLPMTAAMKRRVEKEATEERKKEEKLKAQLKSEKKGLFGLW